MNLYIVSKQSGDNRASTHPKCYDFYDNKTLYLVLKARINGRTIYYCDINDIVLGNRKIPPHKIQRWDSENMSEISIGWFKVEPTDYNIDNTKGGWHWETVPYTEKVFAKDKWSVDADVKPTIPAVLFWSKKSDVGTMRYKATATYGQQSVSSPGLDSIGYSDEIFSIARLRKSNRKPGKSSFKDNLNDCFF